MTQDINPALKGSSRKQRDIYPGHISYPCLLPNFGFTPILYPTERHEKRLAVVKSSINIVQTIVEYFLAANAPPTHYPCKICEKITAFRSKVHNGVTGARLLEVPDADAQELPMVRRVLLQTTVDPPLLLEGVTPLMISLAVVDFFLILTSAALGVAILVVESDKLNMLIDVSDNCNYVYSDVGNSLYICDRDVPAGALLSLNCFVTATPIAPFVTSFGKTVTDSSALVKVSKETNVLYADFVVVSQALTLCFRGALSNGGSVDNADHALRVLPVDGVFANSTTAKVLHEVYAHNDDRYGHPSTCQLYTDNFREATRIGLKGTSNATFRLSLPASPCAKLGVAELASKICDSLHIYASKEPIYVGDVSVLPDDL